MSFSAPKAGLLALVACVVGYGLGYVAHGSTPVQPLSAALSQECDDVYSLLSPFLGCEPAGQKKEYVSFKADLNTYIQSNISSDKAQTISVYFRDLENGPWFGIDEQALFSPASLIKLPLAVAFYKRAETDPKILTQKVAVAGAGTKTVDELIEEMIIESNNDALPILFSFLNQFYADEDVFGETLVAMGISASEGSEDDFLPVKRYASIYRILYNASFLSKESSQHILDLLTKARAPTGIDEGVPENVMVATKFGIREHPDTLQLHDCGIVYHPQTPYILCIMTRGKDQPTLSQIIAEISAQVFAEVEARSATE